jgi:hypothetical protein
MRSIQCKQALSVLFCLWLLTTAIFSDVRAATIEAEVATKLDHIRAMQAGQSKEVTKIYNQQMDEAWQFFTANKQQVLPILRKELKAELAREHPNDLLLLDIGFYIHQNDGAEGQAIGLDALFHLNPRAPILSENISELFDFAHVAAEAHDPRVLPLIERAFLTTDQKVVIPMHALTLDSTLICVFLYGSYGPDVEGVLKEKLKDQSLGKRILEVLVWLGTPESMPEVREALAASPTYETLIRVTSYMMNSAGPAGRSFMLSLATAEFDSRSQEYLKKLHPVIEDTSFKSIRKSFEDLPGDKKLSEAEVMRRLDAMSRNHGKDDQTNPIAILDSGLSSEVLIAELIKVRNRILYRVSDEALYDLQATNIVINGLRYRGK